MKMTTTRPSNANEKQRKNIARAATDLPSKRLNVNIPADLYLKIKLRCAEEDRDISETTQDIWIE